MALVEERLGLAETSRWVLEELQEEEQVTQHAGDQDPRPQAAPARRRVPRPRQLRRLRRLGGVSRPTLRPGRMALATEWMASPLVSSDWRPQSKVSNREPKRR